MTPPLSGVFWKTGVRNVSTYDISLMILGLVLFSAQGFTLGWIARDSRNR